MMKKGLSGIIAVLILLLCLSGAAAAEESSESSEESPGWKITDSSEITEAAQAAFDRAAAELTDAVYEPVALLGEQQGVFCILCRATGDYEGAEPYYTLVYAGENGVQNIWDLWIESHSMPERESGEEEQTVDISTLLTALASEREARDAVTAAAKALEGDELAVFITEKWNGIYFNPDFRIFIDGKDDPGALPVSGKHAFVVLGFELENGEMQDELKARCDAAAAAAEAFPGSILVCSGGATGDNNPEGHTEAGLMKEYLVRNRGIAPERIFIDESAMTTLENTVNTFAILKSQGTLITTPFILEALKAHDLLIPGKVETVGFPMITDNRTAKKKQADGKIRLLFCGWLYSDIRSPQYFLDIVSRLDERFEVTFMGRECEKLQERFSIETKAALITLPNQPYDVALQAMADADVLINIGNSVPVHMPSKTLEYINTGKPMVNFYKFADCPTLYYTKRYPLALNLFEEEKDMDAAAQRFVRFCEENVGKTVDPDWIKAEYADCTPRYIAQKIIESLEK